MDVYIYEDYAELSFRAAKIIVQQITDQPASVICLASGETPVLAYAFMVKMLKIQKLNTEHCTFIGLDEWVGVAPGNQGSCHYFLHENVFNPLGLLPSQIKLFDGMVDDTDEECQTMNQTIRSLGGIDLMVVGIGMNGHIGFNEPGSSLSDYSHVTDLDKKTLIVGQKYFKETTQLRKGITLGLKHFLEAKKALLLANGSNKAGIMSLALDHKVSKEIPASIIQKHKQGIVLMDGAAAAHIIKKP